MTASSFTATPHSPCRSIRHSGDDLTGDNGETITARLSTLPAEIHKVLFSVSLHGGQDVGQVFGKTEAAGVCIIDADTNEEIYNFDLDDAQGDRSVLVGMLKRHGSEWIWQTVFAGNNSALEIIAQECGVDTKTVNLTKGSSESQKFNFWCRHCGAKLWASEEDVGRSNTCPKCKKNIIVERNQPPVTAEEAAELKAEAERIARENKAETERLARERLERERQEESRRKTEELRRKAEEVRLATEKLAREEAERLDKFLVDSVYQELDPDLNSYFELVHEAEAVRLSKAHPGSPKYQKNTIIEQNQPPIQPTPARGGNVSAIISIFVGWFIGVGIVGICVAISGKIDWIALVGFGWLIGVIGLFLWALWAFGGDNNQVREEVKRKAEVERQELEFFDYTYQKELACRAKAARRSKEELVRQIEAARGMPSPLFMKKIGDSLHAFIGWCINAFFIALFGAFFGVIIGVPIGAFIGMSPDIGAFIGAFIGGVYGVYSMVMDNDK